MNAKVKLVESPTIWLLKIDSDCIITEDEDIPDENRLELIGLNPNPNGGSKSTQTLAALQISEKEQTIPLIMKVFHSFQIQFNSIHFICQSKESRISSNQMGFVW